MRASKLNGQTGPAVSKKREKVSAAGRRAVAARDWQRVASCGRKINSIAPQDPEGPFLSGLSLKASGRIEEAVEQFERALQRGSHRYDAAIELAFANVLLNRHAEARQLLDTYSKMLGNSPIYLNLAGQAYTRMNLHQSAWPLYEAASRLQPAVEVFQANMAACAVYLGRIDTARSLYEGLLAHNPNHQRNHYELAQLGRASNDEHVQEMLRVLRQADSNPANNIYLYYALGKELEDLERWDEAFL